MNVQFATCNPHTALEFLKKLYPSQEVTKEKLPKLFVLIEADILRVQDPAMHSRPQIVAGDKYKPENRPEVDSAITELKTQLH